MRPLTVLLSCLAMYAASATAAPSATHPIIGVWRLSLDDGRCDEVYRFRSDGTSLVTSAHEVAESEYKIPEQPSARGFYKLEDKVVRDNGKADCAGDITKVGTKATNFIRFHPSGALFLMCASETMEACIGPFERVRGEDI